MLEVSLKSGELILHYVCCIAVFEPSMCSSFHALVWLLWKCYCTFLRFEIFRKVHITNKRKTTLINTTLGTKSTKPSSMGVRARLFWTCVSGSHNEAPDALSPNYLHFYSFFLSVRFTQKSGRALKKVFVLGTWLFFWVHLQIKVVK